VILLLEVLKLENSLKPKRVLHKRIFRASIFPAFLQGFLHMVCGKPAWNLLDTFSTF
jgi:hypothetical protein